MRECPQRSRSGLDKACLRRLDGALTRFLTVLACLCLGCCVTTAHAGWGNLGSALNGDDREALGTSQHLAAVAGEPWIVWTERPSSSATFQVLAARRSGASWVPTGPLNVDPGHDARSPSIADVGGVPYVAWVEVTQNAGGVNRVRVARWTGSAWQAVGTTVDTTAGSTPKITSVGGVPYVAFFETAPGQADLRVRRWTGSAWADVGGVITGSATGPPSVADIGGVAHIGWVDASSAHVEAFNGSAWSAVGSQVDDNGGPNPGEITLTSLDGAPAAAWVEVDGSGVHLHAARRTGGSWADLGGAEVTTSVYHPNLAPSLAEIDGTPWIAWGGGAQAQVLQFDGDTWIPVGAPQRRNFLWTVGNVDVTAVGGVPHVSWIERSVASEYGVYASRLQDDADTAQLRLSSATYSTSEAASGVDVTIQRTGGTAGAVSVRFTTANGTATQPADYAAVSQRVTFGDGETSKTVTVPIVSGIGSEAAETFTVALSQPAGDAKLGAPATATVTIGEDGIDTLIDSAPSGFLTDLRFRFILFHADPTTGATFTCWLDDGLPAPCTDPFDPGANVPEGAHTFSVRAAPASGPADPTPATGSFFVDTVRPETAVSVAGTRTAAGNFAGAATVSASATDASPGSGVKEVRCLVDPPAPPQSAADMRDPCPVTVTAPGPHTVYAAATDNAGWQGLPTSTTFTVAAFPDTVIASGPSGEVWGTSAQFGLRSTVTGSSFRCRLDGGAFGPCVDPATVGPLTTGDHVLEVASVSPEGLTDPTPASASWRVGEPTRKVVPCRVAPFTNLSHYDPGDRQACAAYAASVTGCPGFKCVTIPDCPPLATCTLTVTSEWFDADPIALWQVLATTYLTGRTLGSTTCSVSATGDRCRATRSESFIGTASGSPAIAGLCQAVAPVTGDYGSSGFRRLECEFVFTITPSAALAATATGGSVSVLAPGAGSVTIQSGPTGASAIAAATRKPAFKTITAKTKTAGPITVTPKLTGTALRTLRRTNRLRLPLRITFTAAGGGQPQTTTRTVTLTRPKVVPGTCGKRAPANCDAVRALARSKRR